MFNKTKNRGGQRPEPEMHDLSWEHTIVSNDRKSKKTAWWAFYAQSVVSITLGVAILFMLPLKTVVPYVIAVDKITGETSVVPTSENYTTNEVLNDKHWVKEFLISHERYNYRLLQYDYDKIKNLAGDTVWRDYSSKFNGEKALDKVYADNIEIIPKILSITIQDGGIATVRYELATTDRRQANYAPKVTRKVATMRFSYEKKLFQKESDAIDNPHGFTISAYQTDSEFVGE